ncbi:ParB N-terminal domain-containing protein [Patescibacteria group bacterium]|nr:ParB N-terminal domain-containing protein [Patescibacteria group bacterium]
MEIKQVKINDLKFADYNPRTLDDKEAKDLKESLKRFNFVEPIIVNSASGRENIIIGGHQRVKVAKEMGIEEVPVHYVKISDLEKERELNLRLNKNLGHWQDDLLAKFDENLLKDVGFDSEELDEIFNLDLGPAETFDLQKELQKLKIEKIETKKGDLFQLGEHRLLCGDATQEKDIKRLMGNEKVDFCFVDPPYQLQYLKTKYKGKSPAKGFGYKSNRQYLETDVAPEFKDWLPLIDKVAKDNFNIIVFENWKNIIPLWQETEKFWKIKNMIIWHVGNRHQGFASKYKFFSKHDVAIFGSNQEKVEFNLENEGELENEYQLALYAIKGKPHWEGYQKGKRICPTDHIDFRASDEKHSGQGIIFGTKPLEVLIPYIKVLTRRGDIVLDTFGGSGSTLCACEKMKRRCFMVEKVPIYVEVIKRRFECLTGQKPLKLDN